MRFDKPYCTRKLHHTRILIDLEGRITISAPENRNTGYINSKQIPDIKRNNRNPSIDFITDEPIAHNHSKYIYSRIIAGKFDHLINKER